MVKGEDLTRAWTLGSMYDMDSIALIDKNGTQYRIKALEVLAVLKKFNFEKRKAKKHTYLHLA